MTKKRRRVTVHRDGTFEINGHRFVLYRGTSVLNDGLWEIWRDEREPDGTISTKPLAVEPTYADARNRIDAMLDDDRYRRQEPT